jgi:peptide/nickel transport system substrate-binding protein
MRMTRRGLRLAAATAVGALLLTACGATDDDSGLAGDGDDGTAEADEPAGDPEGGGELRMVVGPEPATLNPMRAVRSDHIVSIAMVEPLVKVDAESQELTEDGLVTGWERVDDTTWRFTVRDGVEFHNGEAFDAEAAAFAVEEHRADEAAVTGPFFQVFDTVEAISDTEFELTTTGPNNSVPYLLTNVFALPPEHYAEVGADAYGQDPIGTGPFVFEEWVSGEHVRAVANEDYWQDPAHLDAITWAWTADASTRASLLQSGQADLVVDVPLGLQDEIEQGPETDVVRYDRLVKFLLFLPLDGQTEDPDVRRAAAKAIDREGIVEGVYEGVGARADRDFMNSFFDSAGGHEESIEYDPDAAAELIASMDSPPSITLNWPVGRSQSPEAVAGMLETVGFDVERNPLDFGTFFQQAVTGDLEGPYIFGTMPTFPHEDVQAQGFLTSTSITRTCVDERFDELAAEAVAEDDQEGRTAVYNEMERIALFDLTCFVPLYEQVTTYGHSSDVHGFEPARDDLHDYRQVWLDR